MTAPAELRVLHVHLPCRDEQEFQRRLASHVGLEGFFVPFDEPLPEGSRLLLRGHWLGGPIGVSGEAIVIATHSGERPGMTVKLVRLAHDSAQFPITDQRSTDLDSNRFGPFPDETPPEPVPRGALQPAPLPEQWQVPAPSVDLEDFDQPERGPGLQTVVNFTPEAYDLPERGVGLQTTVNFTPAQPTRVHAAHAELLRAAGAALAAPARQRVEFGRYSLLVPLGEEGVLDAWVATAPPGALNIVKATRAPGADSVALARQAKAIAVLVHPNLAKVVDFGEVEGRAFIAFEHLHGRRLEAILARLLAVQLVPQVELAVTIGIYVCRALEYLHSPEAGPMPHGAVHGGSVFVGADGEVRLAPPRLWPLEPGEAPTAEGDLHSLGGLLHDLLTLREPPPHGAAGVASEPRSRWHRKPSEWSRAIPDSMDAVVLAATHADPAARYPSARVFRANLEEEQKRHPAWSLAALMSELFGPELDREREDVAGFPATSG